MLSTGYATKYSTKDTQKEDTESYDEVLNHAREPMLKQMHQSPFSESISGLVGATIVHNSRNVISAPMAAYLSQNNSRFKMSHLLCFLPWKEARDKNAPYFRVIHGHFCPGLQSALHVVSSNFYCNPGPCASNPAHFPQLCRITYAILPHLCHTLQ
jgi:hypothetical protein